MYILEPKGLVLYENDLSYIIQNSTSLEVWVVQLIQRAKNVLSLIF
uniref:Uncharacterized protein n=1 Tax=Arundo donax TaxID=35708 RepID=A0A0A9AVT6_ARUDO